MATGGVDFFSGFFFFPLRGGAVVFFSSRFLGFSRVSLLFSPRFLVVFFRFLVVFSLF